MEVYNANPMTKLTPERMVHDVLVLLRANRVPSCESEQVRYLEMPDGLRLVFREGKYIGWYLPGEAEHEQAT